MRKGRSLTRSGCSTRDNSGPRSGCLELRHTAMLNRWRNSLAVPRAASPIKNIPMLGRPGYRRWNSAFGTTSVEHSSLQKGREQLQPPLWHDSSPLAALNDRYDTVRPETGAPETGSLNRPEIGRRSATEVSPAFARTGTSQNSVRAYGRPIAIPSTSISPENGSAALTYETNITPAQTATKRTHNRPKDGLISLAFGKNGTYTDTSSRILQYQSELDADSDDDLHPAFPASLVPWVSPMVDNTVAEEPVKAHAGLNMRDILHEISEFQSNFVRKKQALATEATSRTQRRALEYRDLHGEQGLKSPLPSHGAPQPLLFGNSLEYSIKIQHETILLEYTQIRLRFSSSLPEDENASVISHLGVLGYLQRKKGSGGRFFAPGGKQKVYVAPEGTQSRLQGLWDAEMAAFCKKEEHYSAPKTAEAELPTLGTSPGENGDLISQDFGAVARAVWLTPAGL